MFRPVGDKSARERTSLCLLVSPCRPTPLNCNWTNNFRTCSRTPWQSDVPATEDLLNEGMYNEEGYLNIGDSLGLSGVRGMPQLDERIISCPTGLLT